jgi:hypothetical protein
MAKPRGIYPRDVSNADVESFLALSESLDVEVNNTQIRRWYGYFVDMVKRYDDKINNHLRLFYDWRSLI